MKSVQPFSHLQYKKDHRNSKDNRESFGIQFICISTKRVIHIMKKRKNANAIPAACINGKTYLQYSERHSISDRHREHTLFIISLNFGMEWKCGLHYGGLVSSISSRAQVQFIRE